MRQCRPSSPRASVPFYNFNCFQYPHRITRSGGHNLDMLFPLQPLRSTACFIVRAIFGLPVLTRPGDAAAAQSDAPGPSGSQEIDSQLALPPTPGSRTQGTITLTAEQWTATQNTLQRLETRLNDQQRPQSQRCSSSRNSRHTHRDS